MATQQNGEIIAAGDGHMSVRCGTIPLAATSNMYGSKDGIVLTGTITAGPEQVIGREIEVLTTDNWHGIITIKRQ